MEGVLRFLVLLAVLVGPVLLSLHEPGPAGPSGGDVTDVTPLRDASLERLGTREQGRGWEGVGRIDVAGRGFCTGALIRDDLVLTAAHCLFDEDGTAHPVERVSFAAGLRDGRAVARRGVRRAVWSEGFVPGAGPEGNVAEDLALLQLDRPIRDGRTAPYAWGPVAWRGARLGVVSYARGRAEAPSLQPRCTGLFRARGALTATCDVDFGASGAPLFDLTTGNARIVAVIAAKGERRGRRIAIAAEVSQKLPGLLAALEAGSARWARPATQSRAAGAKFLKP